MARNNIKLKAMIPMNSEACMSEDKTQFIHISVSSQELFYYENNQLVADYRISTGKNGVGELINSECTPRGWHRVHSVIGEGCPVNSVFVSRVWTNEIYSKALALQNPNRDWILTRIIRLDGLEDGRNKGGDVDTFNRYIYIHGTPDSTPLGVPGSRGCIRMQNSDMLALASVIKTNTLIYIE